MVKKVQKATPAPKRTTSPKRATAQPAPTPARPQPPDEALDGSVESLRRLLSELIESRLDAVARDLAEVRRVAAGGGETDAVLDRIDALLATLGAVRFTAEPMDAVDPLIHAVVAERPVAGVPKGVVIEVVRPGYRSTRGIVLAKAAVAVSAG